MAVQRRLNAWINNRDLRSLDQRILIRSIDEEAPEVDTQYADILGGVGQRVQYQRRKNRRIVIQFSVRELYDLAERARVIDKINGWAQEGYLQVSYRPQKRIYVHRVTPAASDNIRDYTSVYTVEFAASVCPYWEDVLTGSWTGTGTSGTGTLTTGGNTQTPVTAVIVPSGALNTLTLTANGQSMSFTGLGVPSGKTMTVEYDTRGILQIMADGISRISSRTPQSVDELMVNPGTVELGFSANVSCSVTMMARGRWQ